MDLLDQIMYDLSFITQINTIIKNIIKKFPWSIDNMPENDLTYSFLYIYHFSLSVYTMNPN